MSNSGSGKLRRRRSAAWELGILLAVSLAVWAAAAPVAGYLRGGAGVAASAFAMGVCLVAGLLGWGVSRACRSPERVFLGAVLGMLVRMGAPLAAMLILLSSGGVLVEGGAAYYLLVFYLLMLAVETALAAAAVQGAASAS